MAANYFQQRAVTSIVSTDVDTDFDLTGMGLDFSSDVVSVHLEVIVQFLDAPTNSYSAVLIKDVIVGVDNSSTPRIETVIPPRLEFGAIEDGGIGTNRLNVNFSTPAAGTLRVRLTAGSAVPAGPCLITVRGVGAVGASL